VKTNPSNNRNIRKSH